MFSLKEHLIEHLDQAISALMNQGVLPEHVRYEDENYTAMEKNTLLARSRDRSHGDFSSNIALQLAKRIQQKPRALAELFAQQLKDLRSVEIERIEVAGPGFINFFLKPIAYHNVIAQILKEDKNYGRGRLAAGKHLQLEFVSANPTGPLHVGHGRGAAYGASLGNLLEAIGYKVHREYYINDAGRQMDILAVSVWLRYLELCGEAIVFPVNAYQGDYVFDIAASLHRQYSDGLRVPGFSLTEDLPPDEPQGGDKETHIDALIHRCKHLLGTDKYRSLFDQGLTEILQNIESDLKEFGVIYDEWFSERLLMDQGKVDETVSRLKDTGHVYEKEGALWFRSTDYGDEKDRVIVRENGAKTYFASDITYHSNKLERFDHVIDIWGADHHGYVPRIKAAMTACNQEPERLEILLVQFAILYRGGEKVQMSTRSGEFVTLRELRQEVGNDAARFFYVMRKCDQHMDFDLDLAKSESNENPVYYVQYAHARICSVFRQLQDKGLSYDRKKGCRSLERLIEDQERNLMFDLSRYPEVVISAALQREPHQLAHYLRELAQAFHTYYNAHTFLTKESGVRQARLALVDAAKVVIGNGLTLLGVSAPESM